MIRVVVADDHPIVRSGIVSILEECDDIVIEEEANDAYELLDACERIRPDVAISDVTMPGPGIIHTIARIKELSPDTRILILSIHDPSDYALPTLKAGASGYISKHESTELLPVAIKEISRGNLYLTGKAAETILSALNHDGDDRNNQISAREFEVITLLGEGLSFKEIADRLEISPKTVNTYRTRLLEKLNLASTNALIKYAHDNYSGEHGASVDDR